jgi:hypothetical protein
MDNIDETMVTTVVVLAIIARATVVMLSFS